MSDEVKDAELVPEQALAKVDPLASMVKEADKGVYGIASNLGTLDWKAMKPPEMALLLCQKPFPVSGGGTMYLNFRQALWFAVRCHELSVSPFSNEVWFDPAKFSVNLTLEGKRQVARNKGIDLGPPKFEELEREWKDVSKVTNAGEEAKKAGFTKDIGCKCSIRVGDPKHKEYVDYIAWLNEWFVGRSPVWKEKPQHMLQIRAQEKAISMAMGTGASEFPTDGIDS